MELFYIYSALFLVAASSLFSLCFQFQMLQQNSYYASRYFKWIKNSFAVTSVILSLLYFALTFLFTAKLYKYFFIFAAVLFFVRLFLMIRRTKKSIKPIVFTARVKRLFAAALLVFILLTLLFALKKQNISGQMAMLIILLLSSLTPLLCFLSLLICSPVEKAFNRYYINDAKKILKSQKGLIVIGITGSYGKTTTKFILNRILSEKYNTVCTPKSFNTTLGVVRTIRENIKPETQVFICEMGAKKKNDIKEICDIVNPKYGIITSVGEQHLETFKTLDNVFSTKFELLDSVEKNGGVCLASLDSPAICDRAGKKPHALYIGKGTNYYTSDIKSSPLGSEFVLNIKDKRLPLRTKLLGAHSISDIMAAALLSNILGVSDNDIIGAVASLTPHEHRLQLKSYINGSTLLDDAYNSNPVGSTEALRVLGSFEGMRKTVITPGMIELGDMEYEANFNLGKACAENADDIILVGKNYTKPIADAINETNFNTERLHFVSSFKEGLDIFLKYADKNSVLLIENDLPDNYLK
ncbi:MAG: UDP-N-acetylmuramoyl-tripeptide--D-alanyl-D-alanine ligase [Clostridia bacterium]|nr:UDP-N-acetylmuramoyl-tripeptide--D-alanyl-D-alanine ligase [Clostridia bacterium]